MKTLLALVFLLSPHAAFACQSCWSDYEYRHFGYYQDESSDDDFEPSAICRDGSESFTWHRSGTCASHGGVREWRR